MKDLILGQPGGEWLNDINENFKEINKNYSNPNLLINGDFQVWQRGTEFNNIYMKYTADRWIGQNGIAVSKTDNGLLISSEPNTVNATLFQPIEDYKKLIGKTLTLTIEARGKGQIRIMIGGALNTFNTINLTSEFKSYSITISSAKFNISSSDEQGVNIQFPTENYECEINWIKLEWGTMSTPFIPRSYGEELALCQRYCKMIDGITLSSINQSNTNTQYYDILSLTNNMRCSPTLKYKNLYLMGNESYTSNNPAISSDNFSVTCISQHRLRIDKVFNSTNFPTRTVVQIENLLLDAEIY